MTGRSPFNLPRDSDGRYSAYAWPGGYPIAYVLYDGGILCPACANRGNGSIASADPETDPQWRIVAADVRYEGARELCDHCSAELETAYGDPDAEPNGGQS